MTDTTTETGQQAPEQPQQGTTPQAPAQEAPKAPEAPQETAEQTIARLQAELSSARSEAGKSRVNAKQQAAEEARQDALGKVLAALGLEADGTAKVTVEDVTAKLAQEQQGKRAAELELAVYKAAGKAGANPDALLDSRSFMAATADLDPADDAAVKAAVEAAVKANSSLAAQVVRKSGAEFSGGSGEGAITQAQFDVMSGAERNALFLRDPNTYNRLTGR